MRGFLMPRRALLALMSLTLVAAVAGCGDDGASDTDGYVLRVGMTSVTGTVQGNLGWAQEKGLLLKALRPAGVKEIKFSFFQSGADASSALVSGAVDVAVTGDMPALRTRGEGAPTRLLGLTGINGDTWLVGRKGGSSRIRDLVGKNVTAPEGTIRYRVTYGLLHEAGLADKVQIKNVPTPESLAGLSAGSIDATAVGEAQAIELERKGFAVIDKASNHPALLSTEHATALQKFLDAHRGFATAWGRAITRMNQHIRDHVKEYWAYSADKDDLAVNIVKLAEPADHFNVEPFPKDGLAQVRGTYQFLLEQKLVDTEFDIETWLAR